MNHTMLAPWVTDRFGRDFSFQHYIHRYVSPALAAGAQDNNTIRTNGNAYTMFVSLSHHASPALVAAAGVLVQCGDFELTLQVEDRNLQDGNVISTLYGNPVYSNVLANGQLVVPQEVTNTFPATVKPGGYIRFTITNDNLANNIVRLAFYCIQFFQLRESKLDPIESARMFALQ